MRKAWKGQASSRQRQHSTRHTVAAEVGRTDAVQAQGIQELCPLQLDSQRRHVQPWGCIRRWGGHWPLCPWSWDEAVDKVQPGPSKQVGERILPGKQRSAGTEGTRGQWWWETLPVSLLQGV